MKSTGIVRKIDDLGRIVIPMEMRKIFGINNDDPMEIFTEGDTIILKQFNATCIFCGSTDDLESFKDKSVCPQCFKDLENKSR